MGNLYALGINRYNIKDTAQSVIDALISSDVIFVEHEQADGDFLKSLGINNKTLIEVDKVEDEHEDLLDLNNKSVSILTGDGYPAITDPGGRLIKKAIDGGHSVYVLPQVSAIVSAVILSCYPTKSFLYAGMIDFINADVLRVLMKNQDTMAVFLYQGTDSYLPTLDIVYSPEREVKLLVDMGHKSQRIIKCSVSNVKDSIPKNYTYLTIVVSPNEQ
jgi:16S rRNA (cytidine1402-2'-O)-methyltransferase